MKRLKQKFLSWVFWIFRWQIMRAYTATQKHVVIDNRQFEKIDIMSSFKLDPTITPINAQYEIDKVKNQLLQAAKKYIEVDNNPDGKTFVVRLYVGITAKG